MVDHLFAPEFHVVLRVEHLVHVGADQERVLNTPGSRLVMEKTEFQRQMVAIAIYECVHSTRVRFEMVPLLWVKCGCSAFASHANLQIALLTVMFKQVGAKQLGKLPSGVATARVHLPETVLGGYKTLGEEQILK